MFSKLIRYFWPERDAPERSGEVEPKVAPERAPELTPEDTERATAKRFNPQNAIERLLVKAIVHPTERGTFNQALLDATLYAATPDVPDYEDLRSLKAGEKVQLLDATAPDGTAVAALFTSQARIAEAFGSVGYLAFPGEALLEIVAARGAMLNPGLACGVHWSPAQLAVLLGRSEPRALAEATQLLLGMPAVPPPQGLVDALGAVLGSDPRIQEAWLALAQWPDTDRPSWYLDIRTSADRAEINAMLEPVLRRADFGGRLLDMVVKAPDSSEGIGIRLVPGSTH